MSTQQFHDVLTERHLKAHVRHSPALQGLSSMVAGSEGLAGIRYAESRYSFLYRTFT
jgi:hypothetical protein